MKAISRFSTRAEKTRGIPVLPYVVRYRHTQVNVTSSYFGCLSSSMVICFCFGLHLQRDLLIKRPRELVACRTGNSTFNVRETMRRSKLYFVKLEFILDYVQNTVSCCLFDQLSACTMHGPTFNSYVYVCMYVCMCVRECFVFS